VTFADGVLTIDGDTASNSLNVSSTGAGLITLNGVVVLGGQATLGNVEVIAMDGGAGNDTLRIDETNGTMPSAKLVGGPGNDKLTGGSRADIIDGADIVDLGPDSDQFTWTAGDGRDVLNGGDQTDTLSFTGHDGADSLSSNTNTNDESEAFLQLTEDGGTTDFAHYTGFEELKVELGGAPA